MSSDSQEQIGALRGQITGALVLTGAGLGWILSGLSALGDLPVAILAIFALPAALMLAGLALGRAARGLPDTEWSPQMRRVFWLATGGESAGIVLILLLANALRRPEWIAPLIAIVVGLHFFPLAQIFQRPLYHVTGGVLCLIGLASLALVPPHVGPHHIPGKLLTAGLGCGAVLWATALVLLVRSRATLRELSQAEV